MTWINFNKAKATLSAGVNQGYFLVLSSCKTTTKIASLCFKKAIKSPFLCKNFFPQKRLVKKNSPLQPEIVVTSLRSNPLIRDISGELKKMVIFYQKISGKIGSLAEKVVSKGPSLDNIPSLDQVDFWKSLGPALQLTQKHFPKVFVELTGRNKKEQEIREKLEFLVPCLQKFALPRFKLPTEFTASNLTSINSMMKQLKLIHINIVTLIQGTTNFSDDEKCMLMEAIYSISDLRNLLEKYQEDVNKPIHEEDKKFAKNKLNNNPLLIKLAPLTVISIGSVFSAFTIDQEGLLPASLNPSKLIAETISKTIYLMSNQICALKELSFFPESRTFGSTAILQNATVMTGTYGLEVFNNYANEEDYSRYFINIFVNHLFMCAFAYIGTRMCGSKVKVKNFVENRISSVLMYKICSASLGYLRIPFWPNKAISVIASIITNPLIHLCAEDGS